MRGKESKVILLEEMAANGPVCSFNIIFWAGLGLIDKFHIMSWLINSSVQAHQMAEIYLSSLKTAISYMLNAKVQGSQGSTCLESDDYIHYSLIIAPLITLIATE
jgi:hypothetical protein